MSEQRDSMRYWTWRFAVKRPQWVIDRHWYELLGRLVGFRTEKRT